MSDEGRWEPWHRQQIRGILNLVAAVEREASQNTGHEKLQFQRLVNEQCHSSGVLGAPMERPTFTTVVNGRRRTEVYEATKRLNGR
ncbi:MAG: hypothetical protein JO270_01310 [Acidobacteriaceae bacterium]|nr:hypothetical protein [Acidobacteriaceae bacterium]